MLELTVGDDDDDGTTSTFSPSLTVVLVVRRD